MTALRLSPFQKELFIWVMVPSLLGTLLAASSFSYFSSSLIKIFGLVVVYTFSLLFAYWPLHKYLKPNSHIINFIIGFFAAMFIFVTSFISLCNFFLNKKAHIVTSIFDLIPIYISLTKLTFGLGRIIWLPFFILFLTYFEVRKVILRKVKNKPTLQN